MFYDGDVETLWAQIDTVLQYVEEAFPLLMQASDEDNVAFRADNVLEKHTAAEKLSDEELDEEYGEELGEDFREEFEEDEERDNINIVTNDPKKQRDIEMEL